MCEAGRLGQRIGQALEARRGDFVERAGEELGFSATDVEFDVDYTITYLSERLSGDVDALAAGREPICHTSQEVALMLPSNVAVFPVYEIARVLAVGNPVRARLSKRARGVSDLTQGLFDEVAPGRVQMDDRPGRDFLPDVLGSEAFPIVVVWGGESLGDDLFRQLPEVGHKRVVFEGPGKDPAVVLAGAHPEEVASQLVAGKFLLSGQTCTAPENLILHRSVHDAVVERLVSACRGRQPQRMYSDLVPRIVESQLLDAVEQGARIEIGGGISGQMVEPTVVTGITSEMRIFQDETFAPVFSISVFDADEEAVELARGTRYGLRAAVTGSGAEELAKLLRGADYAEPVDGLVYGKYGIVSVDSLADDGDYVAFGGYGKSGWVWDRGQLLQGPKAILREATVDPGSRLFASAGPTASR